MMERNERNTATLQQSEGSEAAVVQKKAHSQLYDIWRSMKSNKLTVACLIFVALIVVLCFTVDILFDYETDVIEQNITERLQSPSKEHWFGTDAYGRDYFARVIYATRVTMIIALSSTVLGCLLGIFVGTVSAYIGGRVDSLIQRVLDVIISIPQVLLVICVVAVLGGGVVNIIISFTLSMFPGISRTVRASVLVARENEYVEASKAVGGNSGRIILSHIIPNSLGPMIVQATMSISACILSTAGLGYLGMGVSAPQPEWGLMLSEAQEFMRAKPYLIIIPGLAIVISALAFNLLGDGLRDAMDPKLRGFRKRRKVKQVLKSLVGIQEAEEDETLLLDVRDLRVKYRTVDDDVMALNGVNIQLKKGESLGIVGETGAGKTTLALSIMGLLPKGVGEVYDGSIRFKDKDILTCGEKQLRSIRGAQISMIFQDPMSSLNPVFTVGDQIEEVLKLHGTTGKAAAKRVDEILQLVGIEPSRKICYPHQFSGGMKQRIVIAMALACEPDLLIADEPTTALDVTIQSQVLAMIDDIQKKLGTSLIMITHDFGIVAETCDKVAIMYAGEIIEFGTLEQVFDKSRPHHPYTVGLFNSIPNLEEDAERLEPVDGLMPDPTDLPKGCSFAPRCAYCMERCEESEAAVRCDPDGHTVKCHLYDAKAPAQEGGSHE